MLVMLLEISSMPRLGFYPQIFAQIQNPNLSYADILRRASTTTKSIAVLLGLCVLALTGLAKLAAGLSPRIAAALIGAA
jgi:hypothetical protein